MASKRTVAEGQVYYPKSAAARHGFRRVILVFKGRVFYSVGGNCNYSCTIRTFLRAVSKATGGGGSDGESAE